MKLAALAYIPITALGAEQCFAQCPSAHTGPINLTICNANTAAMPVIADAVWGLTTCSIDTNPSPNGKIVCPLPAGYQRPQVSSAGYSYVVIADDAGSTTTGSREPLISVLNTYTITGSTLDLFPQVPIAFRAGATVVTHIASLSVESPGSLYSFGSTQTLACSGCSSDGHINAIGTPVIMTPEQVSVKNHGAGGINGSACTLTATGQSGLNGLITQLTGTVGISGGISSFSVVQQGSIIGDAGTYSSSGYVDAISSSSAGCSFSTPPLVYVSYGVLNEQLVAGTGIYNISTVPCSATAYKATTSNDSGQGLSLLCPGTYSGTVAFGTDNTVPLQQALGTIGSTVAGTMNYASANGTPECLYLPAGNYLTQPLNAGTFAGNGTFLAQGYGCWLGDEHFHSNVFVIPNTQGDVFAWLNSNANGSLPDLGNTQAFQNFGSPADEPGANQAGATFRNITVIGDRLSTAPQNAIAFYGTNQFAYINNVGAYYMNGRGLYAGGAGPSGGGDFAESVIQNAQFQFDGGSPIEGTIVPAVEITSFGGSSTIDGANNLSLVNVSIYQPHGPGLWIHTSGSLIYPVTQSMRLLNVKIDGSEVSYTNQGGDLLEIGDPAGTQPFLFPVSDVLARNIDLVNPPVGFAALHIGSSNTLSPQFVDVEGAISFDPASDSGSPDYGRGLQIEQCTQCSFKFVSNNAVDYQLMLGTIAAGGICTGATLGVPGIIYDGDIGTFAPNNPLTPISNCLGTLGGAVAIPVNGTFN